MVKYSAITTCKSRLEHLKQTLPMLCALPDTEVILVDYGCPEQSGTGAATNFPSVKIVEVSDDPGFNLPRARNQGAEHSEGDYLLFIDADVKFPAVALAEINESVDVRTFITIDPKDFGDDIRGTCLVPRSAFFMVGGYDELLRNYGMEDIELYTRLRDAGLLHKTLRLDEITIIKHSNALRTKHFDERSVLRLKLTAIVYHEYTKAFRRMLKQDQIPLDIREQIYSACVSLVEKFTKANDPSGGIRIDMTVPHEIRKGELGDAMDWKFQLSMAVRPKNPVAFKRKCDEDRKAAQEH